MLNRSLFVYQPAPLAAWLICKFLYRLTVPPIVKYWFYYFKLTSYENAKKVNHGSLRDDRPSHGRDVRASKDGLAACRQVNAMASLVWQS
jgi:hypothetical protein